MFYTIKDINDGTLSLQSKKEMRGTYPWANDFVFCVAEPTISDCEIERLAILQLEYTDYRYGAEKAEEILNRIEDENVRKESECTFNAQLKCDTARATEITLPSTVEVIYISSFGRMDRLNKINGLRSDCKAVYTREGKNVMTDITDEALYEADGMGTENFLRALKNS